MAGEIIPPDLNNFLGEETPDFIVQSSRKLPLKKGLRNVFGGLFFFGLSFIILISFIGPIFQGKEVRFQSNGITMVAGPDNLKPVTMPTILLSLFLVIGLVLIIHSLYQILSAGPYFIGTKNRLIIYNNKKSIRSIDWEQFSGELEVNGDNKKADVIINMRTGNIAPLQGGGFRFGSGRSTTYSERFIQNTIYMSGIKNAFQIEQIIRKRIKENDPTQANT